MTTRVANLAQYQRNISYILDTESRLNLAQLQLSSGQKSDDYAGIAGDVRRLVNVQDSYVGSKQYSSSNSLVDQRLQIMESSVSQIFDVLTNYKTLLVNGLNAQNSADLALPTQAQSLLDEVASLLNVQDDGRYLFAGSRTDTAPVDQSNLPASYTIPSASGAASGYYQGDDVQLSVQADVNYSVQYGINADAPGFEEAIRSLHEVIIGTPNDKATMNDALSIVTQALNDVSDIRTKIGAARSALQDVNSRLDQYQLYSEKTISDLENVDVTETITRMNQDQTAIQASFMTLSRLSQLTLTNFLR
jgi:flagellar hook-associated protein 3 FlgL